MVKAENLPRADFVTSIVLIIFGAAVLINSVGMPTFADRGVNPYSAPGIVPGFLGGLIALLGAVLLIRSILHRGYSLGINRTSVAGFFRSAESRRLLLTVGLSIGYALGILGRMPYELATAIYVVSFVIVFDVKLHVPISGQWKTILLAVLTGVLTSAAVTGVFRYLFLVSLPG
jgi:hypothetical protein